MSYYVHQDAMDIDSNVSDEASTSQSSMEENTCTTILDLPHELLAKVAGYLEPVWLYNLAHTNSKFWQMLSFEGGANRIWYDALPASAWVEGEMYQDDRELEDLALLSLREGTLARKHMNWIANVQSAREEQKQVKRVKHYGQQFPSGVQYLQDPYGNVYAQAMPSWSYNVPLSPPSQQPYYQFNGHVSMNPPAHSPGAQTTFGHNAVANPFLSPPQNTSFGQSALFEQPTQVGQVVPAVLKSSESMRLPNKLLGGPYQEFFNYRREVVGRLSRNYPLHKGRCQLCFTRQSDMFNIGIVHHWGITWCQGCLNKNIMSYAEVTGLLQTDEVLYHVDWLHYASKDKYYYYRPGVDHVLNVLQWPSINNLQSALNQQYIETARRVALNSNVEIRRRQYRNLVVEAAKMLWDGIDPYPDVFTDAATGQEIQRPREIYHNINRFKKYRERFCPTDELPGMLFPTLQLTGVGSKEDTLIRHGGWLPDPAVNVVKLHNWRDSFPGHLIVYSADKMLRALVDYNNEKYYHKGLGGYVNAWRAGVNNYHSKRIEVDVESGAILRQDNVADYFKDNSVFDNLHKLRAELGLEDPITGQFIAPAERPKLSQRRLGDRDEVMRRDADAIDLQREHAHKVKHFNKIIQADCHTCPTGSGVFSPKGVDGLLEHMRTCHAKMFWETDDFTIAG